MTRTGRRRQPVCTTNAVNSVVTPMPWGAPVPTASATSPTNAWVRGNSSGDSRRASTAPGRCDGDDQRPREGDAEPAPDVLGRERQDDEKHDGGQEDREDQHRQD